MKMKYALYINNKVVFCSTNKNECIARGVEFLTKEWSNLYSNADSEQTAKFLDRMCKFTSNARKPDNCYFYADCLVGSKYIEVKPFSSKTYEVVYKVSFEKDAISYDDYFFMENKVLCYEDKLDKVVKEFRDKLERNVENDLSLRGETFDNMLGKEVECMQDEDTTYDVFDTINKKYHLILVNEVDFD